MAALGARMGTSTCLCHHCPFAQSLLSAGGAGAGSGASLGQRLRGLLLGRKGMADRIMLAGVDDSLIAEAAAATEGFSGRELAKLVASMQARLLMLC